MEPLLPARPPFTKAKTGFGVLGCLTYDPADDRVLCHECGRWFRYLGAHLKAHGIKDDDYRQEYGLTFNYPLCGRGFSEQRSEDVTPQFLAEGTKMRAKLKRGRAASPRHVGTATEAQKNKYGSCDLQIDARYDVIVERLRRHPSSPELRRASRSLLEVICRRHGTLKKYRAMRDQDARQPARRRA